MFNKISSSKKKEFPNWKLNPGPYDYKLVYKTIALNKHSWICNRFRYITSLFTLKPQNIKTITGHEKTKETSKLKIVNFEKGNRDHKKLPKQDEDTGNEFYYI